MEVSIPETSNKTESNLAFRVHLWIGDYKTLGSTLKLFSDSESAQLFFSFQSFFKTYTSETHTSPTAKVNHADLEDPTSVLIYIYHFRYISAIRTKNLMWWRHHRISHGHGWSGLGNGNSWTQPSVRHVRSCIPTLHITRNMLTKLGLSIVPNFPDKFVNKVRVVQPPDLDPSISMICHYIIQSDELAWKEVSEFAPNENFWTYATFKTPTRLMGFVVRDYTFGGGGCYFHATNDFLSVETSMTEEFSRICSNNVRFPRFVRQ